MSIGAIFVGLALLILSIPILAGPVVNKRREQFSLANEPGGLEAHSNYRQTLLALRDLDFDHQLGIVAEEDYAGLRVQLLAEAARKREADAGDREADLEARIDAVVEARRRPRPTEQTPTSSSLACYQCGAEMGVGDRFCVSCGSAAAPLCSQCGLQADPGDKFCAGCGTHMAIRVAA